jgi:hypothetical protein
MKNTAGKVRTAAGAATQSLLFSIFTIQEVLAQSTGGDGSVFDRADGISKGLGGLTGIVFIALLI